MATEHEPGAGHRPVDGVQRSQRCGIMKACLDSSALAKRFVEEQGSDAVEAVCAQANEF
jgi:hypothetical protein